MEVRPRDASRGCSRERCPYCHDLLQAVADDQAVGCPGCGTQHHAACIAELGRCTVLGCERPLLRAGLAAPPAAGSPARRRVEALFRQRARRFVAEHARRPAAVAPPGERADGRGRSASLIPSRPPGALTPAPAPAARVRRPASTRFLPGAWEDELTRGQRAGLVAGLVAANLLLAGLTAWVLLGG